MTGAAASSVLDRPHGNRQRKGDTPRARPFRCLATAALLGWAISCPPAPTAAAAPLPHPLQVLANECFNCHREDKAKGGLVLTSREAILRGGGNGPVLVPGDPAQSRLVELLQPGADPHMPPRKQLAPGQVRSLEKWVLDQAPWDDAALDAASAPVAPVTLEPLPAGFQPAQALAFLPGTNHLAVGRGAQLRLLPLSTNAPAVPDASDAHPEGVQSLATSPDGRWIASGGFRRVRLWDAATLKPSGEITNGLSGRITALAFAPDSASLAVADAAPGLSAQVRMFEVGSLRRLRSWRAHGDSVLSLQFSGDGGRLVTAGADRLVRIWALPEGGPVATLEGHTAQVLAVGFNTNATQVVSAGADRQLFVWDIATREKLITLGNHAMAVNGAAWPGDSREVFAATEGGTVFRYDNLRTHTGEQSSASGDQHRIGALPGHLVGFAVSADRSRVAAGSQEGLVVVWKRDGKELARLAPDAPPDPAAITASGPAGPGSRRGNPPSHNPLSTRAVHSPSERPSDWRLPLGSRAPMQPVRHIPDRNPTSAAPVLPKSSEFRSLSVFPERIRLNPTASSHGFRVTGVAADGREYDVTEQVRATVPRRAPFRLEAPGEVTGVLARGSNSVTLRLGRLQAVLPVEVDSPGTDDPSAAMPPAAVSFTRDVLAELGRAGCASGGCHSKPEGQNGFKLSVFSYDPRSDHAEIVADVRGRRLFPAAPEESLLLQKPMMRIPHEGGQRFEAGSPVHTVLLRWIRAGMPYQLTNEAALTGIEVFPAERTARARSSHRLLVQARYSDGTVRDVTRLAAFETSDRELASVDEHGRIRAGAHPGTAVVVARYLGQVAASRVLVPAERLLPAERYATLPRNNFIDDLAHARFQRLGLLPSGECSDTEFLRRLKLDAVGLLPTPDEVRAFLADTTPDKRRRAIDRVLGDPAYGDFWAGRWADLLRPNPDRVGVKSVFVLDQWLREQFRMNRRYDEFVRDLILAEGSNHREGPAVVYRDRRDPPELTTLFSQVLLGIRLECAKCHHHPNEKWGQEDFYQFAACFGSVRQKGAGLSPPISAGREIFYHAKGGTVKHPVSGEVMPPRPPDGPMLPSDDTDPRLGLADWATATNNPFLARALVNRVWAFCFGRGMVEPVDDFRLSNPCVHPELLDALAEDFVRHGYDLKHLLRTIFDSRLYQLSTRPNETNVGDTRHFSRAYRRRLPAEVLDDAVTDVTGAPDTFAGTAPGSRATQAWSYKIESQFLDAFGRPNASSDPPCERDVRLSVVQTLHFMNSPRLHRRIAHAEGRARQLARSDATPETIVTELYLAAYSRLPGSDEMTLATAPFRAPDARREAVVEDVLWALLNSPEFLFNH